jgi:hypothetical protein
MGFGFWFFHFAAGPQLSIYECKIRKMMSSSYNSLRLFERSSEKYLILQKANLFPLLYIFKKISSILDFLFMVK